MNQRRARPVLAHAHQQQADVGHEQTAVNGAEQRDHFGLARDVLERHRVEHQDEEGKAFQIADKGHQVLHDLTSTIGLLERCHQRIYFSRRRRINSAFFPETFFPEARSFAFNSLTVMDSKSSEEEEFSKEESVG